MPVISAPLSLSYVARPVSKKKKKKTRMNNQKKSYG
jgi:hypothetical protein